MVMAMAERMVELASAKGQPGRIGPRVVPMALASLFRTGRTKAHRTKKHAGTNSAQQYGHERWYEHFELRARSEGGAGVRPAVKIATARGDNRV